MGQNEVIKFLANNRGQYFSTIELSQRLQINRASLGRACKKLRERKEVRAKEVKNRNYTQFLYSV